MIQTAKDCQGNGSKSTRLGTRCTVPRPSANGPVSTCLITVTGWLGWLARAIGSAICLRFSGLVAKAVASMIALSSAAYVLGDPVTNSLDAENTHQGCPSQICFDNTCI